MTSYTILSSTGKKWVFDLDCYLAASLPTHSSVWLDPLILILFVDVHRITPRCCCPVSSNDHEVVSLINSGGYPYKATGQVAPWNIKGVSCIILADFQSLLRSRTRKDYLKENAIPVGKWKQHTFPPISLLFLAGACLCLSQACSCCCFLSLNGDLSLGFNHIWDLYWLCGASVSPKMNWPI